MKAPMAALLVGRRCMGALQQALQEQGFQTCRARNCAEVQAVLQEPGSPRLVFSDTALPDGTWVEVVKFAAEAREPAQVIVVSRLADLRLYLDTLERGATDFVAPPFVGHDLAHIVRCAVGGRPRQRAGKGSRAPFQLHAYVLHLFRGRPLWLRHRWATMRG